MVAELVTPRVRADASLAERSMGDLLRQGLLAPAKVLPKSRLPRDERRCPTRGRYAHSMRCIWRRWSSCAALIISFGHSGYVALFETVDTTDVVVSAVRLQLEDDYH